MPDLFRFLLRYPKVMGGKSVKSTLDATVAGMFVRIYMPDLSFQVGSVGKNSVVI